MNLPQHTTWTEDGSAGTLAYKGQPLLIFEGRDAIEVARFAGGLRVRPYVHQPGPRWPTAVLCIYWGEGSSAILFTDEEPTVLTQTRICTSLSEVAQCLKQQ